MKTFISVVIISSMLFAACRDAGTEVQPSLRPVVRNLTALEKQVVTADNSFGLKLFVCINSAELNKNIFISPFSVSMALGMALNGADGSTLDSMKNVLEHSSFTMQEINDSYRNLSSLLVLLDPGVTFNVANSVWYKNEFQVYPTFLDNCRTYFDAEAASLDFSSPVALQTINGWVNSKTNGKITTIADNIPPDVVMYLINAVYFKGVWTYQFDPEKTVPATFTSAAGSTPCTMMSQHATFAYRATGQEQVVDLPYGNGLFSLTVVLPAAGISIDEYAAGLTQQKWQELVSNLDSTEIDLFMPKFKVEYERRLNDDLIAMGMGIAFSASADFSRIANEGLFISEVKHKTFVEVDEQGTEAAAVTSIAIARTAFPSTPTMRIDHSFIMAIREHASGTILFIGKIVAPE